MFDGPKDVKTYFIPIGFCLLVLNPDIYLHIFSSWQNVGEQKFWERTVFVTQFKPGNSRIPTGKTGMPEISTPKAIE